MHGLAQMSINYDLLIDPEKVMDELAKTKQRLKLHTLTKLRLVDDGFSLCRPMPTINGLMKYG